MWGEDEYGIGPHRPIGAAQDKVNDWQMIAPAYEPELVARWQLPVSLLSESLEGVSVHDVGVVGCVVEGLPDVVWKGAGGTVHMNCAGLPCILESVSCGVSPSIPRMMSRGMVRNETWHCS